MSRLLGPVTDADLRRWQRRRLELLNEFADLADERELPVLTWKVGHHALIGEAVDPDHAARRRVWEQWVTVLELDRWAPSTSETGRTHLHAVTRDWRGRGVDVVVVADVWSDEPTAEE